MRYFFLGFILTFIYSCSSDDSSAKDNPTTDNVAPVITILGENPVIVLQFSEYEDPGATAMDNMDGDLSDTIVSESNLNLSAPGSYSITYSVTDSSGNASSASRAVIVEPNDNYTYVPDDAFEQTLIKEGYDDILDDYVLTLNIRHVTYISVHDVVDMTGIEDFRFLESLFLFETSVDSLNLSNNPFLKWLLVRDNQGLTYLDISQSNLEKLELTPSSLSNLDLSNHSNLTELKLSDPSLNELDLSNNTQIEQLIISQSSITTLDLTGLQDLVNIELQNSILNNITLPADASNLAYIQLGNNMLNTLDLSMVNSNNLSLLNLDNNFLSSLDFSTVPGLIYLYCQNNQLTSLNLANGNNGEILQMYATDNLLDCIQIDPGFTPSSGWDKDPNTVYSENCD